MFHIEDEASSVEMSHEMLISEMEKVHLIKICKLNENNHIHQEHLDLQDPSIFHTDAKSVTISELFFDLVYAGVCVNLSNGLRKEETTWEGFFQYMIILLGFWKDYTMNRSLFSVNDLLDKLVVFFYGLGILGCAAFSYNGPIGKNGTFFGILAIYVITIQILLDLRACYGMHLVISHPSKSSHRESSTWAIMIIQLCKSLISIVLWIIYICFKDERAILIWSNMLFPFICDFSVTCYFNSGKYQFSPNVEHFKDRADSIILIMLGYIICVIIPDVMKVDEGCVNETIGCMIMGYFIMFFYKIFHFDVEEYEEKIHAVKVGTMRRLFWIWAIIIECIGIAVFSEGIEELVVSVQKLDALRLNSKSNEMMAVGMSIALGGNLISRLMHKIDIEHFKGAWELWICQIAFQLFSICIIFPLAFIKATFLLAHPWCCGLYISIILLILNFLFYMDEVLEYLHWKKMLADYYKNNLQETSEKVDTDILELQTNTVSVN